MAEICRRVGTQAMGTWASSACGLAWRAALSASGSVTSAASAVPKWRRVASATWSDPVAIV
eukprot:84643-Lingulodinium_polyedra.AAC.1